MGGRFFTTQDGRRLFFPWYSRGSGYVIASEQDYERLRRQVKVYEIVTAIAAGLLALAASFLFSKSYIVDIIIAVIASYLYTVPYSVWMRHLLPRLKVTDEKPPRQTLSAWLKALKPIGPWTVPQPSVTPVSGGGEVSAMPPKEIHSPVLERAKHGALIDRCARIVFWTALSVGCVCSFLPIPSAFFPREYFMVIYLGFSIAPALLALAILVWLKRRLLTDEEIPRQSLSASLKDSSQ